MVQAFDGIDAIQAGKKVDQVVIGDLVILLPVTAKPIECSSKLALIETYKPAVVHAHSSGVFVGNESIRFWSEFWAIAGVRTWFGHELCADLAVLGKDAPFISSVSSPDSA